MTYIQGVSPDRRRSSLRLNAEQLVHSGAAPSASQAVLGVDVLELLYRRASNPEFAPDALKLLHELQTHQVELDLVFDQLMASETELAEQLAHYRALYDEAPVPYLVVDTGGRIVEHNQAAKTLFGHRVESLAEHHLSDLVASSSRAALVTMMQALETSDSEASCVAKLSSDLDDGHYRTLTARPGPSTDLILVALSAAPVTPAP